MANPRTGLLVLILAALPETRATASRCRRAMAKDWATSISATPAIGMTNTTATSSSTTASQGSATSPMTTSTTATNVPAFPPGSLLPLARLTFTLGGGTTTCGPSATPPVSGQVDDLAGSKRLDLGLGCLYVGGGFGTLLPGTSLAAGGQSVLDVAGISGLTISVTASDGNGPADCTWGAGLGKHCLNAKPGIDGHGACTSDADCAGKVGACDVDARCFFGTPVPLSMGHLSVCMLNAVQRDISGTVNLLTNQTKVSASLSSRIYLTGDSLSPCPQCVSGTCSGGQRIGLPCSEGAGLARTTIECPPQDQQFLGRLGVNLSSLDTGTSILTDPGGNLCPGQRTPGAFGGEASLIRENGASLLSRGFFGITLAGTFCVPATGNEFLDSAADLPGPGAISVPGTIAIELPALSSLLIGGAAADRH